MNKFSFNRFVTYSKSELVSNRRMLLVMLGSVFAFFMIMFYFNHLGQPDAVWEHNGNQGTMVGEQYNITVPTILSWVGLMMFCVVFSSLSFKKYFKKGYASASLMLPVSQSEKFAFALIFNTIIVPWVLVGMACAISYCWTLAYGIPWTFIAVDCSDFFWAAIGGYIYIALFFYGAIYFRRNQFLYTLLALFAISTVLGYAGYLFAQLMQWWQPDMTWLQNYCKDLFEGWESEDVKYFFRTLSQVVGVLFVALIWRLSWLRFRKLQITK